MGIDKFYRKVVMPSAKVKSLGDISQIWVSPDGDDTNGDGTFLNPYATLTQAFSVVTIARKNIMCMPGEYVEVALTWPSVNGVSLIGAFGSVTVNLSTEAVTPVLTIDPALPSAGTFVATLKNLNIESDYDTGVALKIDNTNMTTRINVFLINIALSTKNVTDTSLTVIHTGTPAIRVYINGSYEIWEGLVDFTAKNTDDRLRIFNQKIVGTLTMNEAIVAELTLINVGIPAAVTVDGAILLTNINCWHEDDANPNTYTAYTNAFTV